MTQLLATRRRAPRASKQAEVPSHTGTLAVLRVRAATVALWGLVSLGALTGILALLLWVAAAPAAPKPVASRPSSAGPEGFAELFVATYLSEAGGEQRDVLRPFYAGTVDLHDVTPGALYVSGTVALDAKELSGGYWSVTVGARILGAAAGTYRPGGMRAYQVGVASTPQGYAATSLPAQVPLPARASTPSLRVSQLSSPMPGPTTDALQRFFAAFLAGDGEVARYVSPDSGIRVVSPAPFVSTAVRGVGATGPKEGPMSVRVEVEGIDADGRRQILQYSLELAQRSGRWEVRRLLGAAPLAHPRPLGPTTKTSTPEDTTTVPPTEPELKGTTKP